MLGDILAAQHLAVADDDAVAVIAAEIRVDGEHGAVPSGDVGDGLVDAAGEAVARKRRAQLADVGELNVADEVGHAVLLLLLDGDAHPVGPIAQLARLIVLERGGCGGAVPAVPGVGALRRGRRQRLLVHLLLHSLLIEAHGLVERGARLRRAAGELLDGLLVLRLRPVGKARLHIRYITHRRAGVAKQQHQQRAGRGGQRAGIARGLGQVEVPLAEAPRMLDAALLLRRTVIAARGRPLELIQGFHRLRGFLPRRW